MTQIINRILILCFLSTSSIVFAEDENEEVQDISKITQKQRQSMGIITSSVNRQQLIQRLIAPGEVTLNAYRSSQVTTRISAQVIKRHARMGDNVNIGQELVTLSSVEMAEAQGNLLVADREWQRVKKLGRQVVSEQRYIEAQVNRQQSYAKVLAYGMSEGQADNLLAQKDASKATGTFNLLSNQAGTIMNDSFIIGQIVEPGTILMEVSDKSSIWVEARINPEKISDITSGALVIISIGKQTFQGKVVQIHPRIDETTRTLSIRIAVDNEKHLLRPGQFVKVTINTPKNKEMIAVPKSSVTLLQGNKVVFKLVNDELHPQLVETGAVHSDLIEIKAGLKQGDEIVTEGMFLLKSLLLKSQIGDAD